MGITHRGGFHDDVGVGAQTFFGQGVVYRAGGHSGMDSQFILGDTMVRQHQNRAAITNGLCRLLAQIQHRLLEAGFCVVVQAKPGRLVTRTLDVDQVGELGVRQYWGRQNGPVGMVSGLFEHIALGAYTGFQAHHDGFAQRIDGRVGHLGKLLTEVVEQGALTTGQHRHGGIVTHGTGGFLPGFCQRAQHLIALFKADLEEFLVAEQILRIHFIGAAHFVVVVRLDTQGIALQPVTVRVTDFQAVIDVLGVQDFTGFGVDGQNLARPDTALGHYVFRLVAVHTDFRGQGNKAVLGHHPASRAQTVAVEHTDSITAVRHYQTGRPIPRLHVHGVIFVEGTQIGIHGFHVLPGRRNHHAHGAEQVHAASQ